MGDYRRDLHEAGDYGHAPSSHHKGGRHGLFGGWHGGHGTEHHKPGHPQGSRHHHSHYDPCCIGIWLVAAAALACAILALIFGLIALNKKCECELFTESVGEQDTKSMLICDIGSGVIGSTVGPGENPDECDGLLVNLGLYKVPSNVLVATTTQVCAYVGELAETGTTHFKMAIYADSGFGTPTSTILGQAGPGNLTTDAWNCLPLVVDVYANQDLWIAFMSDDATCSTTANIYYETSTENRAAYADNDAYPVFPTTLANYAVFSGIYNMYANYSTECMNPEPITFAT